MGVLAARGMNPDSAPGAGGSEKEPEPAENQGAETSPEGGDAGKPEPKGEFVPFSAVTGRKPGSRRDRAAQETEEIVKGQLKAYEDKRATERSTYEQRIQQQAEELAQMRGALEAMQRMPQQMQQQAPKPDLPDPVKLMQEAKKALDERDIDVYHAKVAEAHDARARRMMEEHTATVRKDLEARIPQQLPQEVQFLMAQHRNVALAGPQGVEAVFLKDKELELYRVPRGPARLAKAFELADKLLGSVQGQASPTSRGYSQDSAQALSAVPVARATPGGAGRQEDGVTLTPLQLETIKNLGWSREDYVRWMDPAKFVKR